jgi:hypothetical protein
MNLRRSRIEISSQEKFRASAKPPFSDFFYSFFKEKFFSDDWRKICNKKSEEKKGVHSQFCIIQKN